MEHDISGGLVSDHSNRLKEMERGLADLRIRVSSMGTELETVKEGVANFRTFQRDNREFMGWFKAKEEDREKKDTERAKLHYWWLGILSALIVASIIATASWLMSFMSSHHISSNTSSITETSPQDARK